MIISTQIQKIDCDWVDIKNECRSTVNKEGTANVPNSSFIQKLLISEHSPIRLARIKWRWAGLKSWIATHWVRHHEGVEKWVSTQRSDRTGVNRDKLPQDSPVNIDMEANAQALINMARYRLCFQASPETREQMEDLKMTIHKCGQEEIAGVMQPNCIYRCGCPEFKSCGYWERFCAKHKDENLLDIENRYQVADIDFYERVLI